MEALGVGRLAELRARHVLRAQRLLERLHLCARGPLEREAKCSSLVGMSPAPKWGNSEAEAELGSLQPPCRLPFVVHCLKTGDRGTTQPVSAE